MTLKDQARSCRYAAKEMRKEAKREGYKPEDAEFFEDQARQLEHAANNLEKYAALLDALKAEAE